MELCIILAILLSYRIATPNKAALAIEDRILFKFHQKIRTEKVVKTEILVPYPKYNKTVEEKPVTLTREIEKM